MGKFRRLAGSLWNEKDCLPCRRCEHGQWTIDYASRFGRPIDYSRYGSPSHEDNKYGVLASKFERDETLRLADVAKGRGRESQQSYRNYQDDASRTRRSSSVYSPPGQYRNLYDQLMGFNAKQLNEVMQRQGLSTVGSQIEKVQ